MSKNDTVIQETKNGQGVFANRDFSSGEIIYEVLGKIVDIEVMDAVEGEIADNCFRFDEKHYISPVGEIGNFQNHSCIPNSKVKKDGKHLYIESIKNIKAREEILIDYSTIVAGIDPWSMRCNCGEDKCRKIIGHFNDLPKELQLGYLHMDIVPQYIINVSKKHQ